MANELRVGFEPVPDDIKDDLTDEEKAWLRSWNREGEIPGEANDEGEQALVSTLDPNNAEREKAEAAASVANGEEVQDQYTDMSNEDLRNELGERELPVSGNKPDLQQRLREDDAVRGAGQAPAGGDDNTPPAGGPG